MCWNYAGEKPFVELAVCSVAVVWSFRYVFGAKFGANTFADVQDLFFWFHGITPDTAPVLTIVRNHFVDNYTDNAGYVGVHLVCMATAWLLMHLQIWAQFRKANYRRHRLLGWMAVCLVLIGDLTSIPMAHYIRKEEEAGGMTTEFGFYGMAVSSLFCCCMGVYMIKVKKDVDRHKVWMTRAYGVMWGAFFWFRVGMVIFLPLAPDDYKHVAGLISNLSWVIGWFGADLALSLSAKSKPDVAVVSSDGSKTHVKATSVCPEALGVSAIELKAAG